MRYKTVYHIVVLMHLVNSANKGTISIIIYASKSRHHVLHIPLQEFVLLAQTKTL